MRPRFRPESVYDNYELTKTPAGQFNGVDSEINNSSTSITGNTSTGPMGSSYSYTTSSDFSDVDTASGDVTEGVVTPFAYSSTTTMTDILVISSPPASTVTDESVAGTTSTGSMSGANFTETTTAGHADSSGSSVAENVGSYNSFHAVHDGANEPTLDSSLGLVSAVGGQDANAMEFVGPEVHVQPNATNNAMVVDEGWSGASPITSWVSHPSAIGYRRQGVISAGSGGGGQSVTIAAVAPEFDSGMNDGTDGQELERTANFYTGAEENPTSAQSAPTPRAEQQANGRGAPGGGPSMAGITDPSSGKEPTWTPGFNPYSGHGTYNPFVGWSLPSFWPFGGGGNGGTGGSAGAGTGNQSVDGSPGPPDMTGPSRGSLGGSPGGQTSPQDGPTATPDNPAIEPPHFPGGNMPNTDKDGNAVEGTPTPGSPQTGVAGSEIDPAQPAPPVPETDDTALLMTPNEMPQGATLTTDTGTATATEADPVAIAQGQAGGAKLRDLPDNVFAPIPDTPAARPLSLDDQNRKDIDDAVAELKKNPDYAQLWNKIGGKVNFVYDGKKNTYNLGGFSPNTNNILLFLNNREFDRLRRTNPTRYKQLLKEVITHESIHAYIALNPKNELGLDDNPSPLDDKNTGFGGILPWMNRRYPANGDQVITRHRQLLRYRSKSLDIGPNSQQFLKKIIPDPPLRPAR